MLTELRPIPIRVNEYDGIEARIKSAFLRQLYWPILEELKLSKRTLTLANASEALLKAIQAGEVVFSKGRFSGEFTAPISRELRELGAEWDRSSKTYRLLSEKLPKDLRAAIATSEARFQERMARLDKKLAEVAPAEIAGSFSASDLFDRALWATDREVKSTLKGISVAPDLTPERAQKIATEWQENLALYIKDFADEEILNLRNLVRKNVFAGRRYDGLVPIIQKSFEVTAGKARFLARQETNLLITKFKEARYVDAGVMQYRWACVAGSAAHPVRPSHKILDGKIFSWNTPPITTAPGEPARRNNPGQDFNCRCVAIPVVRFKTESS